MSHFDSSIIGGRQAQGEPEPTYLVAQPISEPILREAARQVGVRDDQPIPAHIREHAELIVRAYANMDQPPGQVTVEQRFLADFTLEQQSQMVRLATMAFGSVLDTLQTSLAIMREEIGGDGAIAGADPETIYRAFQTHVGSSLDLLDQARGRLEEAMQLYRHSHHHDAPIA